MIREGSIRRDLKQIIPMVISHGTYTNRLMFCSDGVDPVDILSYGHIDHCVRSAIKIGLDPIDAISMASKNCFDYYNFGQQFGGIAPGKMADILILDDLKKIKINSVLIGGKTVVSNGKLIPTIPKPNIPKWITSTVKLSKFSKNDFSIKSLNSSENVNAINMKTEIVTEKITEDLVTKNENIYPSVDKDIWKVAAFDRTYGTKKHAVGFLKNFGAEIGAFASSWSFHENDLIVIGSNEKDMAIACNKLSRNQGGMIVVKDGKVLASMPLKLGGIISLDSIESVSRQFLEINASMVDSGCKFKKPHLIPVFLPFLALPDIRILYSGIVDVKKRMYVNPINS